MILFQKFRRFFLTIFLAVVLANAMGSGSPDCWASDTHTQLILQPRDQIATMNRVEAITKNAEGKAQETIGKITGDLKGQNIGKAKQVESQNRNLKQAEKQARNAAEDMKDKTELKGKKNTVAKILKIALIEKNYLD